MPTPNPPRHQCRHIFPNGHRCGSPSLRAENFCYYHHTTRPPVQNLKQRRAAQSQKEPFTLPLIEDQTSLQIALNQVLQRLTSNDLDKKRAGLILYALQIAVQILPKGEMELPTAFTIKPDHGDPLRFPEESIEDTILDPEHGLIAPTAPYRSPAQRNRPSNFGTLLMEDHARAPGSPRNPELIARLPGLQQYADHEAAEYLAALAQAAAENAAQHTRPANLPPQPAEPTTLPALQAVAAHHPAPSPQLIGVPHVRRSRPWAYQKEPYTNRNKLPAHSSSAHSSQKTPLPFARRETPIHPWVPHVRQSRPWAY